MVQETPIDYEGRAAFARHAQRIVDKFSVADYNRLFASHEEQKIRWFTELQRTPERQALLQAFDDALVAAYPPNFYEDLDKLMQHQDMQVLERAVEFLEADTYFFRSGYAKETIMRYVRGYGLPSDYVTRLQQVVLNVVDRHFCREFRQYRKLAHRVDDQAFRSALRERTESADEAIRVRAHWILDWLEDISPISAS